ncbi:hypothetical protein D3C87_1781470 [compost metagenome]
MELSSTLRNMAAELLGQPDQEAGCSIGISFVATLPKEASGLKPQEACQTAEKAVKAIWGGQYPVEQQITHTYAAGSEEVQHRVRLLFGRTFTEAVIDDLPSLVEHTALTLEQLG